jgi:hypothetical protein
MVTHSNFRALSKNAIATRPLGYFEFGEQAFITKPDIGQNLENLKIEQ